MKRKLLLIIPIILLTILVNAQPTETVYPGTLIKNGYLNNIALAEDGPFPIGFNFTFFGNSYSQFYVSANGLLMFTDPGGNYSTEAAIPDAALPNNFIAPFWDDLVIDGSGRILYTTIGAAPNRKLIIQYKNMGFYPFPVFLGSFSVILYESSNVIKIQYRLIVDNSSTKAHGESATIGIENSDGSAGIQYAYHNTSAVETGKAISFTPNGSTYDLDTNDIYEGIYLTTNITLPDPGISLLLSPPQDAVIGSDFTFSWSEADYAASYTLYISTSSDLGGATAYPAGTNLSYDVTGLTLGTTYYWGVFSTNSTGITWCEIKKFNTSATPPLASVPQTVWTEQGLDKTIKLNYTGGDESAKTAIITVLPVQGKLYQYNGGVRGAEITSGDLPASVSDPNMNVIYSASGTSGNGAGNFNYLINDTGGNSPAALVTVNVSPPGVPSVLYLAKSTNTVEIQFDRKMADPAGKQSQFTVTGNTLPVTINTASLKTGDPYTIVLTLASTPTEPVTVSYTQGDVASTTGGLLFSFADQSVTLTSQNIAFTQPLDLKYSDSPFTLSATGPGGAMTYSSSDLGVATIVGSVATFHAVGSSDITARQTGNATYAPALYTRTLSVAKGDQTITFNVLANKTFGDPDFSGSATASSGLVVSLASDNTAVATIEDGQIHIVGVGSATITASQAGNGLWNAATNIPQTLTVNIADQTITFGALLDKSFGDADFSLFASASSGLDIGYISDNIAVATVSGNIVHIVGVGTTTITASQGGDANYNAASDVPQTLNVYTANATITLENLSAIYDGLSHAVTATTDPVGLTVDFLYDGLATVPIDAGSYSVEATINDASYHGSASGTLVIDKADQAITFDVLTDVTYGDADFTISAVAGSGLQVDFTSSNTAVATVTGNTVHIVGGGLTMITASQTGDDNYNAAPDVPQTLTVDKADQTITFTVLPTKTYGDADFTISAVAESWLQIAYTSSNTAVATVYENTIHIVGAGSTTLTASQSGDDNYNAAADVPQTLTVDKADQTITFSALPTVEVGDPDFDPGASASSGLTISYSSDDIDVATILGGMIHIIAVGEAVITASQAGNANYNTATDVPQTLTVDVTTNLEDPAISKLRFSIYSAFNHINIKTLSDEWDGKAGTVRIIDITGQTIRNPQKAEFHKNSMIQLEAPATRGIYLVELKSGVMRYVGKVVVR
jgi:MBG domain